MITRAASQELATGVCHATDTPMRSRMIGWIGLTAERMRYDAKSSTRNRASRAS